jgi:hypothetical protein
MVMTTSRTYSIGELQDLRAAKDYAVQQLGNHFASYSPTWVSKDPTTFAAYSKDWAALQDRYDAACSSADDYVREMTLVALDVDVEGIDATDQYNALLTALNPSWQDNTNAPGSLGDLDQRLTAASGTPTDYGDMPQPTHDNSWEAWVTGAGYKLGLVAPGDVPPGTPGGPGSGDPSLFPTWLKWGAAAGGVVLAGLGLRKLL